MNKEDTVVERNKIKDSNNNESGPTQQIINQTDSKEAKGVLEEKKDENSQKKQVENNDKNEPKIEEDDGDI